MISAENPSRLRLITLLIPPSHDPLLTPYQKQINPKILPLKRNFSILSNIRESPTIKEEKLELSKNDFEKINRSYQSLKKFKKTYTFHQIENEEDKECDPRYINLVELRKSILIKKKEDEKSKFFHIKTASEFEVKESSFLGLTEPIIRPKSKLSKSSSTFNKSKLRYLYKEIADKDLTKHVNVFEEEKSPQKSAKHFLKR